MPLTIYTIYATSSRLLSAHVIQHDVNSMRRRNLEVIRQNGGHTRH